MIFERTNLKSKKQYYTILIIIETLIYFSLFFLNIYWVFLILIFPFYIIEIISNKRCLNRQKNFITKIEIKENELVCNHVNKKKTFIKFDELLYSFREIKFEKDKSEIEIKKKRWIGSKLIGRLHISNWNNIFEIVNEFNHKKLTRVKFKPEGFWSKYGGLTADIAITSTAIAIGEIADIAGSAEIASDATGIALESDFKSLHDKHEIRKQ